MRQVVEVVIPRSRSSSWEGGVAKPYRSKRIRIRGLVSPAGLILWVAASLYLGGLSPDAAGSPAGPAAWGQGSGRPHRTELIDRWRPFRFLSYSRLEMDDAGAEVTFHQGALGASSPLRGGLRWTREVAVFVSRGHVGPETGEPSAGSRNANTSGLGVSLGLQFFFGVTSRVALALEGAGGGVGSLDRFPPDGDRLAFTYRLGASFSIRVRADVFLRMGGQYQHVGRSPDESASEGAFEGGGVFIAVNRWSH